MKFLAIVLLFVAAPCFAETETNSTSVCATAQTIQPIAISSGAGTSVLPSGYNWKNVTIDNTEAANISCSNSTSLSSTTFTGWGLIVSTSSSRSFNLVPGQSWYCLSHRTSIGTQRIVVAACR